MDDLYSLDSASLAALQPLHALVFLFKWVAGSDEKGGASAAYDHDFTGFFMRQVSMSDLRVIYLQLLICRGGPGSGRQQCLCHHRCSQRFIQYTRGGNWRAARTIAGVFDRDGRGGMGPSDLSRLDLTLEFS